MTADRIAINENGLHPQAKFLYNILHAYIGADGVAIVDEAHIAAIMQISPARLRGYRSLLNASGYCTVKMSDGKLIFTVTSDHLARDIARGARESDHEATAQPTADALPKAENDHLARDIARGARAGGDNRGGERERDLTPPLQEKNSLTHSFSDEQKMSVAVLTDPEIGLSRFSSQRLAVAYPFADIRVFCCQFADSHKPGDTPGLIAYRLEAAETVPALIRNDLYQRHRTPSEIAADEQRQAQADEENRRWEEQEQTRQAQQTQTTVPVAVSAVNIWQMALNDLALSMPAPTYETWVRDTDVLRYADGEFVIGVPTAYARDWLSNRLRPQIKRIVSRLLQRSTEVTFAVRPRPHTPTETSHA